MYHRRRVVWAAGLMMHFLAILRLSLALPVHGMCVWEKHVSFWLCAADARADCFCM